MTNIRDMKLYLILLVTLVCLAISTKASVADTDFQMEMNRKSKNCLNEGERCWTWKDECCSGYCEDLGGRGAADGLGECYKK